MTVCHLVGRFPTAYEHAVADEIAALGREGLACRIIALSPSGDDFPMEFVSLAERVQYLDIGRDRGRCSPAR